jgi:hypothetical protein
MKRPTKYVYLWIVQGDYGYGHGWEDLAASEDWREARDSLRDYRENEGGRLRMIQRRELREVTTS